MSTSQRMAQIGRCQNSLIAFNEAADRTYSQDPAPFHRRYAARPTGLLSEFKTHYRASSSDGFQERA